MYAIENDVLAPHFKSLNNHCALWYNARAHCATTRVRLLMPVVCVWHLVGLINCHLEWIGIGVRKCLTEYYSLHIHVFYHVLLGYFFVVCLDPSLVLPCMQHTRRLTRVQHMKHYSRTSY